MRKPWDKLRQQPPVPQPLPILPGSWITHGHTQIDYKSANKSTSEVTDLTIGFQWTSPAVCMTAKSWREFHGFLGELLDQLESQ